MKAPALLIGIFLLALHEVCAQPPPAGPTARLSYDETEAVKNPIDIFMYFIPLTSPALVRFEQSPGNSQQAWVTAYDLQSRRGRFKLRCEFAMDGEGYYVYEFDHDDIIAINTRDLDPSKTITNLDYIRFQGGGFGAMEINGHYADGKPVITNMIIHFAEKGAKSPVFFGMYSIDPVDGVYDYAGRYNMVLARIGSLSFQKTQPGEWVKMGVKLAALGNEASPDGFFSTLKAVVANFFVAPVDIDPYGNDAIFDFAMALYLQKDQYTFPLAANLIPAR